MKQVAFLDVCDIQGGTQPPKAEWISEKRPDYVRMLQIRDFTQPDHHEIEYVRDRKNLKKCEEDDILIARYGASLGKILGGLRGAYNVAMAKCVWDRQVLDRGFLLFWLRSEHFQQVFKGIGSRAAQAGFNKADLQNIQIPLPPLAEQKRIAAILDTADALRAKRRATLAQLDALVQSTFLEMFGDPVTNPKGWEVKPLHELIQPDRPITYGILKPGPDVEGGIPYVRVVDIRNEQVLTKQLRRTTKKIADQYKRSRLTPGDLLMSIRGHVGRMAIVPHGIEGSNITQDTARLALEHADPRYVMQCISTLGMQHYMARRIKGVAVQGINLGDVKKLPITTPSLDLQRRFAAIVESIEHQKALQRTHLAELDALFASLQHRAFAGELSSEDAERVASVA